MAKRTQEMLNERWKAKEEERLLRKLEKKMRKEKELFYELTDKDLEADEAYARLLELANRHDKASADY